MIRVIISKDKIRCISSFGLGFLLLANFYLIPWLEKTPRATDVLGFLLGVWLIWVFLTKGLKPLVLCIMGALAIPFILWGLYSVGIGDFATTVLSVRWLLALPWAYALYSLTYKPGTRQYLLWGMWWGAVFNLIVMGLQYLGYAEVLQNIGLAAQDSAHSSIYGQFRTPGMHGHPNGGIAVVSIIIPLSLYMVFIERKRLWVLFISLAILFLGGVFTSTRSAVLVSLVCILTVLMLNFKWKRTLKLVAMLFICGSLVLSFIGPPGGWNRWLDERNLSVNSSERFLSTKVSLALALEYPLGLGVESAEQQLIQHSSIAATHNAFTHTAMLFGILVSALLLVFMVYLSALLVFRLRNSWFIESILALHLLGLFFFEEHHNNPTFIILSCWLIVAGIHLFKYLFRYIGDHPYEKNLY
ncbi:O-antigen ligase family protein [Desulfoscipio geothermicus]|uniref:O-antigen ligase like membrane protein n=1 Tax=Desulfoscipio geothermicus DSM 3669 TaxID=1121426 RepID=A0A1I6E957_9FIRM|nr:O-antigen ligase family protein [Desulfoscipio geothermicus]SFR14246.1 O-antigen ligase like membrane protein [Desulfoscipio geothermicus DSM 3669]